MKLLHAACGVSGTLYTLMLCLTGCSCLYSCFYRSKLRGQYFLEERPCTDCCVHCCCEECALCQEYRELMHHGFDMSIGFFLSSMIIFISLPFISYIFNLKFGGFNLIFKTIRVAWEHGKAATISCS